MIREILVILLQLHGLFKSCLVQSRAVLGEVAYARLAAAEIHPAMMTLNTFV